MGALDDSAAPTVVSTAADLFRLLHGKIREIVQGLDREALNWTPDPAANSIAVLVTHTLGSEREMLAAVRGIVIDRDRPAEFKAAVTQAAELIKLVDHADADLDKHARAMTAHDLAAWRPRGDRPPRPGLEILINGYGHSREHVAQIELTAQLYRATVR